jgi:hypothetical protein
MNNSMYHFGPQMLNFASFAVPTQFIPYVIIVVIWSLFWKGLALWHSARHFQPWWFIIFMFVNTFGILEIIYLFAILKHTPRELFRHKK